MIFESPVARVYAEALLGACAEEDLDEIAEEVDALRAYLGEHRELLELLGSPAIDAEGKHAILDDAFADQLSEPVLNLLHVLVRNGRLWQATGVADAFHGLWIEETRRLEVLVRSPIEIDEDRLSGLETWLEGRTGLDVVFDIRVEPELLGGLVVQVGDLQFDGSVRSRLDAFRDEMGRTKISTEVAYEAES